MFNIPLIHVNINVPLFIGYGDGATAGMALPAYLHCVWGKALSCEFSRVCSYCFSLRELF